jgi:gelsolin
MDCASSILDYDDTHNSASSSTAISLVCMALVMNTYQKGLSAALHHDIHIWIGNESTQDEYGTAAYKMVEADDFLGGIPVQHRQVQGHESEKFKGYFEFLEYLDGGIESGFNHVEPTPENPFLFRVKGTRKKMTLTQVALSKNSLNDGDSFILTKGKGTVWCWHGNKAHPLEKANSNSWALHMCVQGHVVVMDQGDGDEEYPDFWGCVGEGVIGPHVDDDHEVEEFIPVLYRVDGDPTKPLEKVATGVPVKKTSKTVRCLQKSDLDHDDVFLLDNGWEVSIWVGKGADHHEKLAAMAAADRYAKIEPRALELPVVILKDGRETEKFQAYFE